MFITFVTTLALPTLRLLLPSGGGWRVNLLWSIHACIPVVQFSDDHPLSGWDRSLSGRRAPDCRYPAGERGADPHRLLHLSVRYGGDRAAGGNDCRSLRAALGSAGGALIFVIASLVAGHAEGINQFYLGRFWQGVGAGALYIMTFTVLRDVLSQDRLAMALSMINGVICVIPVLAPVLGYLILSHFDWRGIFVAMALVAAVSGLVNLLLLKETRPVRQPGSGAALPFALLRSPALYVALPADQCQRDLHSGLCQRLAADPDEGVWLHDRAVLHRDDGDGRGEHVYFFPDPSAVAPFGHAEGAGGVSSHLSTGGVLTARQLAGGGRYPSVAAGVCAGLCRLFLWLRGSDGGGARWLPA